MGGISIMSMMTNLLNVMSNKIGLLMSSNFGMSLMAIDPTIPDVNKDTSEWSLGNFLITSRHQLEIWFQYFVMILGIVCIAIAIWQMATGLMSHGKKQTNWAVSLMLLMFGGILALTSGSGWDFMIRIAAGGADTIEDLGGTEGKTTTITKPADKQMIMPDLTVLTFDGVMDDFDLTN